MSVKRIFFFLQYFVVVVFCFTKPDKACQMKDQQCITRLVSSVFSAAITDNSPGFESIDPMHHDLIVANLPAVNFTIKDTTVKGLKDLKVMSASVSNHTSVYINLMLPRYEMSGMYEVNGNFMNSPITGSGHYDVKGNDIKVDIDAMKGFYKKDDKVYIKIKSFEFTTELVGKLTLNADNLFNGKKELADSVLELINSNDKILAAAWNPPITKANLEKLFNNVNMILGGVSLNEIVIENPKVLL